MSTIVSGFVPGSWFPKLMFYTFQQAIYEYVETQGHSNRERNMTHKLPSTTLEYLTSLLKTT
jgi:hypothetical protein